ncbi:cell division protein ZapA [Phascolarctobacterium succinatutens CAG:287]|uniref:Cell division protein ZapA n=1 Tax=Phascolarctobacterium succinatutens CAG:287 TaxID=1263101 RepID=R6X5R7_9FIRM|nr:cell division protein ZapA [Phascolarctobacterium succinatutens]CDD11571.1 cell division protein ZapA [Phascolarctobacterium succinatutens CAG:287]
MEKASVSVKIYNSTYALTTSASEEQVLKIAAEVDRRMQELAESKKLLQTDKIAIWTALDLAAERLELQEKCAALKQELQEKCTAMEQEMQQKCIAAEQQMQEKYTAMEQQMQQRNAALVQELQELQARYERLLAAVRER